jgi:uncharacterized protein
MKKLLLTFVSVLCISIFANGQEDTFEVKNKNLYNSILKNDMDAVVKLLNEGADANYVVTDNNPPLKINMLIAAVNKKNISMVKTLIEHKADVNFRDGFDTPAIIYAASTGSKAMVELLFNNGADIKAENQDGDTVLSAAKDSKNTALINYVKEKNPWKN